MEADFKIWVQAEARFVDELKPDAFWVVIVVSFPENAVISILYQNMSKLLFKRLSWKQKISLKTQDAFIQSL